MKLNLRKSFSTLSLVAMTMTLSGCMATMGLLYATDDAGGSLKSSGSIEEKTLLSDKVIAMGKSKTPISSHEHALVLIGESNSYLIEPAGKDKMTFERIFTIVDLSSLYIRSKNETEDTSSKVSNSFEVLVNNDECEYQHGCHDMELYFKKPLNDVLTKEQVQLESLGFDCYVGNIEGYLTCKRKVKIGFTVANQVQNFDNLQYKLKQQFDIRFYTEVLDNDESVIKKGIYYTLLPVTMAIDVVTFPLQYLYYKPQIDQHGF